MGAAILILVASLVLLAGSWGLAFVLLLLGLILAVVTLTAGETDEAPGSPRRALTEFRELFPTKLQFVLALLWLASLLAMLVAFIALVFLPMTVAFGGA